MKKTKNKKGVEKKIKKIVVENSTTSKPTRVSPELEKATSIAEYYGFSPFPEISVEKSDISLAKKFSESHLKSVHPFAPGANRFSGYLEEKIAIMRSYSDKKFQGFSQPIMGSYEGPLHGNPHIKRNVNEETFNLEIINSAKSIAEATIIETALIILKDRYPKENLSVQINSLGDKESIAKFSRELSNYCKKESKSMTRQCRQAVKKDVFEIFNCDHNACLEMQSNAPKSMSFLSEASRTHFKEVLEYLESLNIPYTINHTLIGRRSYCTETIFEIRGKTENIETTVAIGARYNGLAKKIWNKKDVPALGVALLIHPHFIIKRKVVKPKAKKIKFFFIQFGFDAKLKSLQLIETLRQSNIPVEQSLSKDKLSAQLGAAEKMNIPYILIMGQKEAIDSTVVVRDMNTRSQETVDVSELVKYLRKLK